MARFHFWGRLGGKVLIAALALAAVLTVLAQLLLPQLERYQASVEQRLSAAMHAPVRIGRLRAYWIGLKPDITIDGLKIYHPRHPQTVLLQIPHIHLELALWQSLSNWDWRLDAQARGLDLHIAEQSSGEWVIEELLALGPSRPEVRKTAVDWLLKQADLQFDDVSVELHPYQQDTWQLSKLQLINRNRDRHHDFRLTALLNQQPVKFFANLQAQRDFLQAASWRGQIYARLPVQSIQSWLPARQLPAGLTLADLQLGGEFWLDIDRAMPQSLIARLAVPRFAVSYQQKNLAGNLATLLSWHRQVAAGWQLVAEQVQGTINNQALNLPQVAVEQQAQTLTLSARGLDIQALATQAQQWPLPPLLQTWLAQAQPRGAISTLRAELQAPSAAEGWRLAGLAGEIKNLHIQATSAYPGVNGLNIWFVHNAGGGQAGLNIKDGGVDLRQIYRVPTPVNQLQAFLSWHDLGDGWLVRSNDISLANQDAHGHALLSLWVPKAEPDAAQMHLLASIYDGRLDSVWRYVPWPSAGDDTLAWLKQALLAGSIRRGDFLYEGVLFDRPGRPPSTMQMNFAVDDGRLAYADQWPELKQLNANVSIYNHTLQVSAENAQIYESIARRVTAIIPDLNHPSLTVNADLDSTGDDVMRLFQDTSLKQDAGRVADLMEIKGEIAGQLELEIPLASDDHRDIRINVMAELPGNPVLLKQASEFDLWLSGGINYRSGEGLSSRPMQGFFLSQPVTVRLASLLDGQNVAAIQIQANGQLTPANLKPWFSDLTHVMHGSTQYQAALTVPVTDESVHISITSDLAGWSIDLPEPLGKKNEPMPLHYEMQLDASHEQTAYLMLGPRIQSAFGIKDGKITRALVQLGENWVGDLPSEGLWVRGHLPLLDIDDWLPWLRPQTGNALPKSVGAGIPELQSFNVDIDQLLYGDYVLRDARIGLEQEDNKLWRLQLISNDLSGEALLPHNRQQAVTLNLQTINLPFEKRSIAAGAAGNSTHSDWLIPKINIHISDLNFKSWPRLSHSQLESVLTPSPKGIRLSQTRLKNDLFSVDGNLDWQWRGTENTMYSGQINISNIANLFSAFNRVPVLNSQSTQARLSLNWSGNPTDLALSSLNGQLAIDVNKGRILNLNRMVSLSRLFGVLDSDNFKRRLKFDFSDITQKGLVYDNIHFDADIDHGLMSNQLVFHSPSLAAQGQGQVNLVTTEISQLFDISVPISSAVPYAAAVVVGPVIGGALVAAEAMFDDPLTRMTTLHYQIKGKWQNPTVERVKKPILPWRNWFRRNKAGTGVMP